MRIFMLAVFLISLPLPVMAGSLPFTRFGVIDTPDAYLLEHTEIEAEIAASGYSLAKALEADTITNSEFMITGHFDLGLFRYAQIGASFLGDGGFTGNLKIAILHEGVSVPAFAIGLQNISMIEEIECFKEDSAGIPNSVFYQYGHRQNWSAYGVVSKDLTYLAGIPVTVNFGIGIGRFIGSTNNRSYALHGIFSSVVYRPTEVISLAMEMDGRDLNFGVSYDMLDFFTLKFAWAELEQTLLPGNDNPNPTDVMTHSKITIAFCTRYGPIFGADRLQLEAEQQRIDRARDRLDELEERRRDAEEELQNLRDMLESN